MIVLAKFSCDESAKTLGLIVVKHSSIQDISHLINKKGTCRLVAWKLVFTKFYRENAYRQRVCNFNFSRHDQCCLHHSIWLLPKFHGNWIFTIIFLSVSWNWLHEVLCRYIISKLVPLHSLHSIQNVTHCCYHLLSNQAKTVPLIFVNFVKFLWISLGNIFLRSFPRQQCTTFI